MAQKTNGSDFAFNSIATRLKQTTPEGINADNPPLTKREYFAAMAMQGILSNPNNHSFTQQAKAIDAVDMADELIKMLNK